MTFSTCSKKYLKALFSVSGGNKKLKSNDYVRFMIFNLPAKKTCPYATECCKKECYACKAERVYPSVLPSRNRNFEFTKTADFVPAMIRYIELTLAWERKHKNRLVWVRIHESGDFYNREYTKKWLEIMRHFEGESGVVFHIYTKSLPYFEGETLPKNLAFMASVWADTSAEMLALIKKNNYTVYTAFEGCQPANTTLCRCDDCGGCKKCIEAKKGEVVACEIH